MLWLPLLLAVCGPREEVVLFATGVADLDADDAVLAWVAADLADDDSPVCVDGATDGVGATDDNLELGARRAGAVAEVLVAKGVPRQRLVLTSKGEDGAPQEEVSGYRRVVVRFTPRAPEAADVLDLPLAQGPAERARPERQTPRQKPKLTKPMHPVHAWLSGVDVAWRKPAGALIVATGAACGAAVGLGLCCVAPFTAPLGVSVAAGAVDEVAEPDALGGAGIGAMLGGAVGTVAVAAAFVQLKDAPPVSLLLLAAAPASAALGAAIGAVAGWWNSASARAVVAEMPPRAGASSE